MPDLKKLKIPTDTALVLLKAPQHFVAEMAAFSPVMENLQGKQHLWVMAFVSRLSELTLQVQTVFDALAPNGVLWVAFPKKSSGIQTDLNRDSAYRSLEGLPAQWLSLISIDETWSAFALRKTQNGKVHEARVGARVPQNNPFIDVKTRTVSIPDYLTEVFKKYPAELSYFEGLAFSHRKEYIVWVSEAKKQETRDARILKMIKMLQSRKKNPTEK